MHLHAAIDHIIVFDQQQTVTAMVAMVLYIWTALQDLHTQRPRYSYILSSDSSKLVEVIGASRPSYI